MTIDTLRSIAVRRSELLAIRKRHYFLQFSCTLLGYEVASYKANAKKYTISTYWCNGPHDRA